MTKQECLQSTENKKSTFFYGYVIVIVSFFIITIMAGIFYSFGIFLKPLSAEFGWTRVTISGAYSMFIFMLGFLYMVSGRLSDRFGPRIVTTICGCFAGLGLLLMSQVNTVWQLYLFYGLVVAMGISGGFVPLTSTVARWFVKRRGMMTGIVVSSIGAGQMVMPPIARWLISSYGWRTSYAIIGIISLVLIISAAQFLRHNPGQMGLLPYGEREIKKEELGSKTRGLSIGEAVHTGQFWMVIAIYFCYGFFLQSIMVHIAPHATELGISPTSAANILAIIGGAGIVGRVIIGSASDRVGARASLAFAFILASVILLWLQLAEELWMLYLFAVIFGFAYGGIITVQSPFVARLFGLGSHGAMLGIVVWSGTSSGAIGSLLAGYIFDITGNYYSAFWGCAIVGVIGFILVLLLRPIRGLTKNI